MKKRMLMIASVMICFFSLQACFGASEKQPQSNSSNPSSTSLTPQTEIREGQVVRLEGAFQGWQSLECSFSDKAASRGKTRSDWIIRLGSNCYYVTGGLPAGLDAFNPDDIGKRIFLEARPVRNEEGKILLQYISSKRLK